MLELDMLVISPSSRKLELDVATQALLCELVVEDNGESNYSMASGSSETGTR